MTEPVYDLEKIIKLQHWVEVAVAVPMIAAVFFYGFVVFRAEGFSPAGCTESLKTLIYALIGVELAAGFILKKIILGRPKPLAGAIDAAAVRKICAKRFKALMTALVCTEAVALHGVILVYSGCGVFNFYLFAAVSLAAFAWHFPRRRRLEKYVGAHIAV